MNRFAAPLLLAAAVLAAPAAVLAADGSLALQPSADSVAAGGTVDIKVLGLLHPGGKASVLVRAAELELSAKGGGTVAPASADPGETRWVYRAPEAVPADATVTIEARLRGFPDASGTCTLSVKASAAPKPASPASASSPGDKDDDGDAVAGEQATEADPVGSLCTLEKWRVRTEAGGKWTEKKVLARGETMHSLQPILSFDIRVNRKDATFVEVHWWRNDRPKGVRAFTEKNRQVDVRKDQDGMPHISFSKEMGKPGETYTFSIVVTLADGKTVRENMSVYWGTVKQEEKKDRKN